MDFPASETVEFFYLDVRSGKSYHPRKELPMYGTAEISLHGNVWNVSINVMTKLNADSRDTSTRRISSKLKWYLVVVLVC